MGLCNTNCMQLRLNKRWLYSFVIGSFLVSSLVAPLGHAQSSSSEKEFIMSCTYGVLAGTLVGAASLAFVDKPGDNLRRVARGASLGLYAGIALGYYTVYYLPQQLQRQEEDRLNPDNVYQRSQENLKQNQFAVYPTLVESLSHEDQPKTNMALGLSLNF